MLESRFAGHTRPDVVLGPEFQSFDKNEVPNARQIAACVFQINK
jgi:hypothetical protein